MSDINKIIKVIDEFLVRKNIEITTAVAINPYLEKLGLLNDSASRPGLPVSETLKKWKNLTCISNRSKLANSTFTSVIKKSAMLKITF